MAAPGTHAMMLVMPPSDPGSRTSHAFLNLAAAGAIVWGSRLLG